MTDKEFRRLSREELVEIIYELQRKELALRRENAELQAQLSDRALKLKKVGSIAEASLALSGVFEAAQAAADRYLEAVTQDHLPQPMDDPEQPPLDGTKREPPEEDPDPLPEDAPAREEMRERPEQEEAPAEDAAGQDPPAASPTGEGWESFQTQSRRLMAMHAELQSLLHRD